jgi:hypothetical protein
MSHPISSFEIFPISETGRLLHRFPQVELSYETISHKKVLPPYDVAVAIPHGKKYYAWFSFYGEKNVVYILELNKERKIVKILLREHNFGAKISCDTVVYGVFLQEIDKFMVEDILIYKGISMKKTRFNEKIQWLHEFLEITHSMGFCIPAMWRHFENNDCSQNDHVIKIPEKYRELPYIIHHIQYRSFDCNLPWKNFPYNAFATVRKIGLDANTTTNTRLNVVSARSDFSKPQYKFRTIFQVTADIQYDIYHLFAYGKQKTTIYYDVAYIPNYKTSVLMNRLFRNIRENENLDAIEESDDEEDFQNISEDKYVDLQKTLFIECQFHTKFKRWIPLRVINNPCKVVHISQL